jgi:thioredoxin 1
MKTLQWIAAAAVLALAAGTANSASREIYPDPGQARTDLAAALQTAAVTHKRVLLDFGGNWCGDCQVLDIYFHAPANRNLLDSNYVLVPVNIGRYDENLAIAARYGIPITRGVPALAVLDASGQVVYSQRNGEFEAMGRLDPTAVTAFLLQWKG